MRAYKTADGAAAEIVGAARRAGRVRGAECRSRLDGQIERGVMGRRARERGLGHEQIRREEDADAPEYAAVPQPPTPCSTWS